MLLIVRDHTECVKSFGYSLALEIAVKNEFESVFRKAEQK